MSSGIFWAIVAGCAFGLFQTVNRRAVRQIDIYLGTLILLTISALILGALAWFTEDAALWGQVTGSAILWFGLAGLIHFFLGWTLLSMSQKRIGAARTGAIMGATPVFGTIIGQLWFNEVLAPPTLLGIGLVIVGVYVVTTA